MLKAHALVVRHVVRFFQEALQILKNQVSKLVPSGGPKPLETADLGEWFWTVVEQS